MSSKLIDASTPSNRAAAGLCAVTVLKEASHILNTLSPYRWTCCLGRRRSSSFRRRRYSGRYPRILDDRRGVTDIYNPASVIAKARYPSSFTIWPISVSSSGPTPCSLAHRRNSSVASEDSISATSIASSSVISWTVKLRDVIIMYTPGASGIKYRRSIYDRSWSLSILSALSITTSYYPSLL